MSPNLDQHEERERDHGQQSDEPVAMGKVSDLCQYGSHQPAVHRSTRRLRADSPPRAARARLVTPALIGAATRRAVHPVRDRIGEPAKPATPLLGADVRLLT